jgi:glycosyltransferase involved in cell wall biosynthesis
MKKLNQPRTNSKITIGIPVYNGEHYLRKALESVVLQSYMDFTVIISDNASTDGTNAICLEYEQRDNRIVYNRQKANIGGFDNFKYILNRCKTEYFVYLAADDSWHPNFLQKNIELLESDKEIVCCISKVVFEKDGTLLHNSNGTFQLDGLRDDNLKRYLLCLPNDNSRFYGVFRPFVLHEAFVGLRPFHATDWYMMAVTLMYGKHIEVDEVLMYREVAEPSRYLNSVRVDNNGLIYQIFPLLPMTCALIRRLNIRQSLKIVWPLIRLNYIKHKEYLNYLLY